MLREEPLKVVQVASQVKNLFGEVLSDLFEAFAVVDFERGIL
jgi:hypothetical protein